MRHIYPPALQGQLKPDVPRIWIPQTQSRAYIAELNRLNLIAHRAERFQPLKGRLCVKHSLGRHACLHRKCPSLHDDSNENALPGICQLFSNSEDDDEAAHMNGHQGRVSLSLAYHPDSLDAMGY